MHKQLAKAIFQSSVQETIVRIRPWLQVPHFNLQTILHIVRGTFCEISDYLDETDADMQRMIRIHCKLGMDGKLKNTPYTWLQDRDIDEFPPAWTARVQINDNYPQYEWYCAVWLRVNTALAFSSNSEKVNRFINAHIPLVNYLDTLDDPRDIHVDTILAVQLYQALGKSRYDEDRNFVELYTERHVLQESNLETIVKHYPDHAWTLESKMAQLSAFDAEKQLSTVRNLQDLYGRHKPADWWNYLIYYASLAIMMQCRCLHGQTNDNGLNDALWFYYCAFLDFLYNCGGYSDVELLTPKENSDRTLLEVYYPHANRAFTAYDLPNAFHVMITIPLEGEQCPPPFQLGKFIQKSMPFCCARRTLIARTDELVREDLAFWRLFSCVFYCLLMDAYPSSVTKQTERLWDIDHLLETRTMVTDRDAMRKALSRSDLRDLTTKQVFERETDKGCHVVFTAFRMWILMMVHNQHHYIDNARKCINWDAFCVQTCKMAAQIQTTAYPTQTDPFSTARELLVKLDKSPQSQVYRYRKTNLVDMLLETLTHMLEKDLYNVGEFDAMDTSTKERILNLFMRVPRKEWFTPIALSILKLPEYGNVLNETVWVIFRCIDIYNAAAKPKDLEQQLQQLNTDDFQVVCWFVYVLSVLQRISFQLLSSDQVESIEYAMCHVRHVLFPGQKLPHHAYSAFVTLCCRQIKTLEGASEFGHADIAYDMDRQLFVCSKTHKKEIFNADDLVDMRFEYKEKKRNRDQRKSFNHIPCKNNPVLDVSLHGFALVYAGVRYMHCPRCGCFHKYDWSGWSGSEDGRYRCQTCKETELTAGNLKHVYCTCTVCGIELIDVKKCTLTVVDPLSTRGVQDVFQTLYFCKRHHVHGVRLAWGVPKDVLMKVASERAYKNLIRKNHG